MSMMDAELEATKLRMRLESERYGRYLEHVERVFRRPANFVSKHNRYYAARALGETEEKGHPRMDLPLFRGLDYEAYMGIGLSASPNPSTEPTLDLALYALHMAEVHPKSTMIVADTLAIANRMAVHGESFEKASKKVAAESSKKIALIESVRESFGIPEERLGVKTWDDVKKEPGFRRTLRRLKLRRAVNPLFRVQLYKTIPQSLKRIIAERIARESGEAKGLKRIPKKIFGTMRFYRELHKLSDYSLAELALILSTSGVKVGHQNESKYDRLAAGLAEKLKLRVYHGAVYGGDYEGPFYTGLMSSDWLRTGDIEFNPGTGLVFAYLPGSIRPSTEPIEPYLTTKHSLLITDPDEVISRKCDELGKEKLDKKMKSFASAIPSLRVMTRYDDIHGVMDRGNYGRVASDEELERRGRVQEAALKAWNPKKTLLTIVRPIRETYLRKIRG